MKKRAKKLPEKRSNQRVGAYLVSDALFDDLVCQSYMSLDQSPEIMTGVHRIAELISMMTIHLMANTERGDVRIINELSRKIDIDPMPTMTRRVWMEAIVMNLLLYGKGNSIVVPHTYDGYLQSLEPISASRVQLVPKGDSFRDYYVVIDGVQKKPDSVLHFVHNVDKTYLWKGKGLTACLQDVANNLKQASATEKGFMESKWKPSLIVKVDAMTDEFSSKSGRKKLLEEYVESASVGEPWLIPAEQFSVEQVRPLSLADLAIDKTVELDKRTVASILGIPPFVLGIGDYDQQAWNNFVQNTIRPIAMGIQQELTKKLIISPKWYFTFNMRSLMDWDLNTIYQVFGGLKQQGVVTGNEIRDMLGLEPLDGLDELTILENYLPVDRLGDQKKLIE